MAQIGITKYTSQNIHNLSFDDQLKVQMVEIIGANGVLQNPATEETLASLAKTEDSAHVTGDKGVMLMGVRDDGVTVFGDNLDYVPLATNYQGALKTVGVSSGGVVTYPATEATQLLVKSAIENIVVPAPVGGATEVTALDIKSLTETLQELSSRLVFLAGLANAGAPALRVIPIGSVSTAVTGSVAVTTLTTLTTLTNFGTGVPASLVAQAQFNLTAIQSNINNVTV